MIRVQIFVEGIADKKFLEDYLIHLGIDNCLVSAVGGKDEIKLSKVDFEKNYKLGIKNVIIFDADQISKTKLDFQSYEFINEFEIDFFFFPNNSENGDLETILENIINTDNSEIFECWSAYEICLDSKVKNYTTPARKTKIYAYLEALLGESKSQKKKIKEENRNYLTKNLWNLDSTYLDQLKNFIQKLK